MPHDIVDGHIGHNHAHDHLHSHLPPEDAAAELQVLATQFIENRPAFPLDPASPDRKTTSKGIIGATRQWPEEGGPAVYQQLNRTVFEDAEPGAIERVIARWPGKLQKG